jgi:hypothetical protein
MCLVLCLKFLVVSDGDGGVCVAGWSAAVEKKARGAKPAQELYVFGQAQITQLALVFVKREKKMYFMLGFKQDFN